MQPEGSLLTGVWVVLAKEAADYLSGARMWLLEVLVFLTAIGAAYAAILSVRATIKESPFQGTCSAPSCPRRRASCWSGRN